MSWELSLHAKQRLRQRSLGDTDVDLVLGCGVDVGDGRVVLRRADAEREIARRKREIERLQRLRDTVVVLAGSRVLTGYRADTMRRRRRLGHALREHRA